ncbi:MAG: fibronectin type III domain-containing protein [Sedimentisphaerales bacterium]|nr:fibronectin type III domain-containing protein [Sedimentisphaerales bacterium]
MAKRRIPTKPAELRDQMMQAATAIGAEANWPATAPTQLEVGNLAGNLYNSITEVDNLKAQLAQARATLRTQRDEGVEMMQRVDAVTDGLYGPDGAQKNNFGLPPKKTTPGASEPLGQVIITLVADGTAPASIFLDWDTDAGAAAYQVEWYTDAALTQQVGNAAVSESEYEIAGLTAAQQYWMRVRGVRGSEYGPWSDPATRVANI